MSKQRLSMEDVYMMFTFIISQRSTCKRYGTGSVITSPDLYQILSVGYNGTPRKTPHNCKGETGKCGCIHSEINAIIKATYTRNAILFCTHSPCLQCAKYIIQAEISKVYYNIPYRNTDPIKYLEQHGIQCQRIIPFFRPVTEVLKFVSDTMLVLPTAEDFNQERQK